MIYLELIIVHKRIVVKKMPSLKDFVSSNESKVTALSKELTTKISGKFGIVAHGILSSSDKEKFSNDVAKLAHSDETLCELSDNIGEPLENESEDEFVNRAKSVLDNLLRKKLKNNE